MFWFLGGSHRPHRPPRRQYVLQQRVEHGQLHRQHVMKKLPRFVNEKLFLLKRFIPMMKVLISS
jgi:hypothetical protein